MEHQASYAWITPIEKLMTMRANTWVKYDSKLNNFTLHVHCDQLLIRSESKILESLNMNDKLKGIYKDNVLLLFVGSTGKDLRKIKFSIKTSVVQCLRKLGEHFSVTRFNTSKTCTVASTKYRNIEEVMKNVLTQMNTSNVYPSIPLPKEYSNFIRLCLLDPAFPQVVKETEKVLKKTFLSN